MTEHSVESTESARQLLDVQRERAERLLNGVRAGVLGLLAAAALAYAPSLTPALNRVNVLVMAPTLAWTVAQYLIFYRRERLPSWLSIANPIVDITAVSAIILGYALAQSAALALKTPIFLSYFVILAARPIASSTARAALVAALAVAQYALLVQFFVASGRIATTSPLAAPAVSGVSLLDESAKVLLLALAGAVATYATAWHERLAISYFRQARHREQLEARLERAQLQTLKLQLQPHFLFNTLNTITALISVDPRIAERMVSGLSELLRLSLRNAGEQEVPLSRELELLEHYVEIQQIRFRDRLTVNLEVAPDAMHALVPNFILQPLVENAIRHGIGPRAAPGHVDVRAYRENGSLHLRVADNGVGVRVRPSESSHEGIGLGNTKARLEHLYGKEHQFNARGGTNGGFVVDIVIPFRPRAELGGA
jgi:two-component sensor histidine kinase